MKNIENKIQKELDQLNRAIHQEQKQQILPSVQQMLDRDSRRLVLERKLSEIRQLEYADDIDIGFNVGFDWYTISSFRGEAYLICDLINVDKAPFKSAVFQFLNPIEICFGGLNDEVFDEHDLFGKGIDICGFFLIKNSYWKRNVQKKMQTHASYCDELWTNIKHYLFRDKGGEFACLASTFEYWFSYDSIDDFRKKGLGALKK